MTNSTHWLTRRDKSAESIYSSPGCLPLVPSDLAAPGRNGGEHFRTGNSIVMNLKKGTSGQPGLMKY